MTNQRLVLPKGWLLRPNLGMACNSQLGPQNAWLRLRGSSQTDWKHPTKTVAKKKHQSVTSQRFFKLNGKKHHCRCLRKNLLERHVNLKEPGCHVLNNEPRIPRANLLEWSQMQRDLCRKDPEPPMDKNGEKVSENCTNNVNSISYQYIIVDSEYYVHISYI